MSNVKKVLDKNKINYKIYKYKHDADNIHFAEEASQKLGINLNRIFKTLIVQAENDFFVGVIPSGKQLDLKIFAKNLGVKKIKMGEKDIIEKITGYTLGGISPIGQKKNLKTFIDLSAKEFETIFISAGNKGIEVEIKPGDLSKLLNARFADIRK